MLPLAALPLLSGDLMLWCYLEQNALANILLTTSVSQRDWLDGLIGYWQAALGDNLIEFGNITKSNQNQIINIIICYLVNKYN